MANKHCCTCGGGKRGGEAAGAKAWLGGMSKFKKSNENCSAILEWQKSNVNSEAFAKFDRTGALFTDPEFPADYTSLLWDNYIGSDKDMLNRYNKPKFKNKEWMRLTTFDKNATLWGNKGV